MRATPMLSIGNSSNRSPLFFLALRPLISDTPSIMTQDVRWKQRFENFNKALHRLREALAGTACEPHNHLYQIALIGAFQFTFELSWKTMKDSWSTTALK